MSRISRNSASKTRAYTALQAWKHAIFSDPFNFTVNWTGPNVCSYGGVYCTPSQLNASYRVVGGIDLNHGDIAGFLPDELGLLTDLALFHINSNRFCDGNHRDSSRLPGFDQKRRRFLPPSCRRGDGDGDGNQGGKISPLF
ncbi:Leucine rich repeat N-terminal domain-containing protein [Forsythia ovata]|uniref:Leucine rich repeat N-terminal domain-containing protein n=1 Tax=Forsythia ovata TaxID=205694 RepID=A0ABD1WHW4_9LAMI